LEKGTKVCPPNGGIFQRPNPGNLEKKGKLLKGEKEKSKPSKPS